ncbi:putative iron-regulated membrane protein [Sphingomonas jinjuensis]|uniref:Putative iron-regulated membrane protein n=1 Tax=Sphingomonas jinjuensis TaxID=535907 RepID=A0A840FEJ1_9SPHN|nr:PepSY-associated TM helix domain-containing protein [Sphingomonas jinjuensis]MBB4154636.1 putative iron-regulated membrane protein [Sphingomonas jinjuensis]
MNALGARPHAATDQRGLVQRALGGHAALGLLASALLYLIALTGTLVVIHDRWQRWEQPGIAETQALSPAAAQAALAAGMTQDVGKPRTTHLYLRMPNADLPRPVVTTDRGGWYTDAAGRVIGREAHAWTEFVIALHEYLTLPLTFGMIVVGALGVVLVALVVTGVLAHPRIVRDAFTLRARSHDQIAQADWHNRLGVWTLPFVVAVALTGSFIGLGSVGFSVLAKAYTGGDMERAYAPIFGAEPIADPAPAPLADAARALTTLARRVPHSTPTYIIVHDPGTAGQHIQIIAEHPRRLVYGETYVFGGDGGWLGPVGLSDGALGKQLAASTYNLHFGNFAGLPVEIAYMLLGLALCVVTATGTTLWLGKRRRRGLGGRRLAAGWDVVVWGMPIGLVAALWLRAVAGPDAPLVWPFWGIIGAGLAIAAIKPAWIARLRLPLLLGGSIVATALGHLVLLRPTQPPIWALDLVALVLAAAWLWTLRRPSPQLSK